MMTMLDVFVHRVQTIFLQIAFVAFASIAIGAWLCLGVFAISVENFKPFLRFVFDACVNSLWRMWRLVFESAVTSVRFLLFFGRRREEEVKEEEEEDEEETPEQQQKRSSSSKTKNIHLLKAIAIIRHLVRERPIVKEKILKRDPECVRNAAYNHTDKVVKYLVEQCEAKFDESACLWASLLGNIKALRYLREVKNCPWNKVDCMRAAYGCEDAYKRRKICEWIEKQPYNSRV